MEKESQIKKNMTLKTRDEKRNKEIWVEAGYGKVPSIHELVESLK